MATASVVLVSAIVLGVAWVAPALAQPGVVFGVRVPGDHRDDPAGLFVLAAGIVATA